jgi:peptidyl-prolyl cis-trans isomerase SurA
MIMKKFNLFLIICILITESMAYGQQLVESVAAIVGDEVIYLSDVESTVVERRRSERTSVENLRSEVFHDMLITKLFLDQAKIDSIEVGNDGLEGEVNMRVNDAIRRAGSEEILVDYFKKSMIEIRRDIRDALREQQVVSEVQAKISENLAMTPAGVRRFSTAYLKTACRLYLQNTN